MDSLYMGYVLYGYYMGFVLYGLYGWKLRSAIHTYQRSKSIYTSVILAIPVWYLHEGIDSSLIPNENIDIYLITTRKYRYLFDISRLIITIYAHVYTFMYD